MRAYVFLMFMAIAAPAVAQTAPVKEDDKAAVIAAVQKFFDTMASRDVEGARSVLMADGKLFAVRDQNGQPTARGGSMQDYLDGLGKRKQEYRERMWSPEVRIHGPIAALWTPYDFWVDGKFSHCGIDAFDLIKTPDGWKISGGVYTVERTGCAPSPLGPLK
jgi:Putative lumazine-binding